MKRTSIIKESTKLRTALKDRWKDLGLSQQQVADDAQWRGMIGINRQGISKYFTHPYSAGALNEYHIQWLAYRYGVFVTMAVGIPDRKVVYKIPKEFNENHALKLTKEFFPETII